MSIVESSLKEVSGHQGKMHLLVGKIGVLGKSFVIVKTNALLNLL